MYYNVFFVFLFFFNGINGYNTKVDMNKLCQENNHSLFIRENIPITLLLTSFNSAFICSIEVSSNSPTLEFNISSLKLPFSNSSTCADSVTISSFTEHISQITARFCSEADLPENDIITAPSPADITIIVSSPPVKWNSLDYKFEVTIGTNFIKSLKSDGTRFVLLTNFVIGIVVLATASLCASVCCAHKNRIRWFIGHRLIHIGYFGNEPAVCYRDLFPSTDNVNENSSLLDGKSARSITSCEGSSSLVLPVGKAIEKL